jgi:hypothetical protein
LVVVSGQLKEQIVSFYLVQRLNNKPEGQPANPFGGNPHVTDLLRGAGAAVELDLMSKGEFDPCVPSSGWRLMQAAKSLRIVTQQLVRPTYEEDVHFVCTPDQADTVLPDWQEWSQNPNSLVPTGYFKDADSDYKVYNPERIVGWWALDEDLLWSRDPEIAETLRSALVTIQANTPS